MLTKITTDSIKKARDFFIHSKHSVYQIYDDGGEGMVESLADLDERMGDHPITLGVEEAFDYQSVAGSIKLYRATIEYTDKECEHPVILCETDDYTELGDDEDYIFFFGLSRDEAIYARNNKSIVEEWRVTEVGEYINI